MPVASTVLKFLEKNRVTYHVLDLKPFLSPRDAAVAAGIAPGALMKAVVVHDGVGLVMATMPANHELDIEEFGGLINRPLELATDAQLQKCFHDCTPRFLPPLGIAYGMGTVVHKNFAELDTVYFLAGDRRTVVRVDKKNFQRMYKKYSAAIFASGYSRPAVAKTVAAQQEPVAAKGQAASSPMLDIKSRIRKLGRLPAMPEMGQRILVLRSRGEPDIKSLAEVVELDPSLAAQVMRYARSPFFGYRGTVDSVRVAMARVLGYDMVMNLALGLATAKPFKTPRTGPLGLDAFWYHAIYSAALVQALSGLLPPTIRPPSGLAYLAGLSHNFGHLLVGHMFKEEFMVLNRVVENHPDKDVLKLEQATLGIDHAEIGAMLMDYWKLPEEVVIAIKEHHNENYNGPHAVYPHLVLIADRMLKRHGLGDASSTELPRGLLEFLEISEYQLESVTKRIMDGREGLDTMAQQLAA